MIVKDSVPYDAGLLREDYNAKLTLVKSPKDFTLRKVDNSFANNFVFHHHYLRRRIYIARNVSYGLFASDYCVGVIMYGFPVWREMPGLCPPLKSEECPELIRLATLSGLPKNTESYLIGRTLRLMVNDWKTETGTTPKCVTSLCDIAFGFNGSIYRATNFKILRKTGGRATNPGQPHGKWKKNTDPQKAEKIVYVFHY